VRGQGSKTGAAKSKLVVGTLSHDPGFHALIRKTMLAIVGDVCARRTINNDVSAGLLYVKTYISCLL
jgi:hypothetical protein